MLGHKTSRTRVVSHISSLSTKGDLSQPPQTIPILTLSVAKTAKLVEDNDDDGGASVGDVLEYSIVVQNNGKNRSFLYLT